MSDKQDRVAVNGTELHLVNTGQGSPTLVFLHYWGGSSRTWAPVIAGLSASHRCVAIDFRGWGESGKAAEHYDLHTLADDVVRVAETLALDDYVLIGHSMGGKVAQLVAARRPAGLRRLILMAPAPPGGNKVPAEQRLGMLASYQTREGAESVVGILSALPLSPAQREQVIADTLKGAPGAKRAWPEQGMTEDISEAAAAIDVPVRVIVGGADPIEPETELRRAFGEVIPAADFIVLPGAGHLAPLEATAAVTDAIRATLAPTGGA